MAYTIIDKMNGEFLALINLLDRERETSMKVMIDSLFKKTLALAAASYFENEISKLLIDLPNIRAVDDVLISNLIKNKAIYRQYHTYFNWEGNNANQFFGYFGEEFKSKANEDVKKDDKLAKAIRDFLWLGNTRNQLAHLNFASFALDLTAAEIYEKYISASYFIEYVDTKMRVYGK
jgi:hypothetical protein